MSETPAGWYPDGSGQQRYWDGTQWTDHTAPGDGAATPQAPATDGTPAPVGAFQPGAPEAAPAAFAYPAGGGAQGTPTTKNKALLFGGIAVAAVAVIAVVLYFVLGGGGGSGDPKAVAKDFATAIFGGDCEKAVDLLSSQAKDSAGSDPCDQFPDFAGSFDNVSVDVQTQDATIDGDAASVPATITMTSSDEDFKEYYPDGYDFDFTIELVKEGGDWKVDNMN